MGKLNALQKTNLNNSGVTAIAKTIAIESIEYSPLFQSLFVIQETVLQHIIKSIKEKGYDKSQPIHVWNGILIDGHTRVQACKYLGLASVPAFTHDFENEDEAFEYAIGLQTSRRNLSDSELLQAIKQIDKLKESGRKSSHEIEGKGGKSSEETAQALGISRDKVEKVRAIEAKASEEIKEAVKSGEKSINQAYNETKAVKRVTVYEAIKKMKKGDLAAFLAMMSLEKRSYEDWVSELDEVYEGGKDT